MTTAVETVIKAHIRMVFPATATHLNQILLLDNQGGVRAVIPLKNLPPSIMPGQKYVAELILTESTTPSL